VNSTSHTHTLAPYPETLGDGGGGEGEEEGAGGVGGRPFALDFCARPSLRAGRFLIGRACENVYRCKRYAQIW